MEYGLIGEKLGHSFSKIIHTELSKKPYELCEIARDELDAFMTARDFSGINVTIPYKEKVIPYLDYIDGDAEKIGAVNTVVKKDGKLFGYNTDAFGLEALILHTGIKAECSTVAVLGTGGTSKTARAVAKKLGAKEIITVSRTPSNNAVDYAGLYSKAKDIDIIINTTPVGMYPNTEDAPIDLELFPSLSGVIDAVYNPLRSALVLSAKKMNIPAEGGLYMLVAQAVRASMLFLGVSYPDGTVEKIYTRLLKSLENVVLIGMPSSGKSTVGRFLADALGREFIDTDELIRTRAGMEISEVFEKHGEEYFRNLEASVIRDVSTLSSRVIATGGGAPMFARNISALRKNGRLFFIDRPKELLMPTSDRPLSQSNAALYRLYDERRPKYIEASDEIIDGSGSVTEVARLLMEKAK